jgi:S1-C subfamily serine protease
LLGVLLDTEAKGDGVAVQGFSEHSGAKTAGLQAGDRLVKVGGEPVASYADIRIALIGSRPGQKMPVEVLRERLVGADERLSFDVELH